MNQLRRLIGLPALVGLPVSLVCQARAAFGFFGVERVLWIPLLVLAMVAFTLALVIDVKIGKNADSFPLFESSVGMYHAWLKAPVMVVIYSVMGFLCTYVLGGGRELHDWPRSPQDAQVVFAVVAAFLAISLPSIYTKHLAVAS